MMNTVRNTFHSFGDRSGDLARSFGSSTADLAKDFGSSTADLARRFGDGTASLAKQIGPRRAMIGLVMAAVAIGGTVMVIRYLRARRVDEDLDVDDESISGRNMRSSQHSKMPGTDVRIPH
jgi:hypothetical protein